jgi:hypothetical protein
MKLYCFFGKRTKVFSDNYKTNGGLVNGDFDENNVFATNLTKEKKDFLLRTKQSPKGKSKRENPPLWWVANFFVKIPQREIAIVAVGPPRLPQRESKFQEKELPAKKPKYPLTTSQEKSIVVVGQLIDK